MKKFALIILLVLIALSFFSCSGVPYVIYEPQAITDNPIGDKIGIAPTSATGIQEAANRAGITRIATVDIRITSDGKKIIREFIVSGE